MQTNHLKKKLADILSNPKSKQTLIDFSDLLKNVAHRDDIFQMGQYLKVEEASLNEFQSINIAVLSDLTCHVVENYLHALLFTHQIKPNIYMPTSGKMTIEVLDKQSDLYRFKPDIILVLLDEQHVIDKMPTPWLVTQHLDMAVNETLHQLNHIISSINEHCSSLVIINTISLSYHLTDTILDYRSKAVMSISINNLNNAIFQLSQDYSQVVAIDSALILQRETVECLRDERLASYAGMRLHDSWLYAFSCEIVKVILAYKGITKKCLVLDLDNTLWGGIIGDDGIDGILLGGGYAGNAYKRWQQVIKQLKAQGVMLAINSKNELTNVLEVFEKHSDMCLTLEDFVCIKANWQPKSENMQAIASELNIGLDSIVFVDDSQAECELIRQYMPEVTTLHLTGEPSDYQTQLISLGLFNKLHITNEDILRTQDYQAEVKRKEHFHNYQDINAYLHSLDIHLRIFSISQLEVSRISQLSMRTNQFNLTGIRYSPQEVEAKIDNDAWLILGLETQDKFGKNGIVGALFIELIDNHMYIRNFLLSCRIFSRHIETAALSIVLSIAKQKQFTAVVGAFVPTTKNILFKDLYIQHHFERFDNSSVNTSFFINRLEKAIDIPTWLTVNTSFKEHSYA